MSLTIAAGFRTHPQLSRKIKQKPIHNYQQKSLKPHGREITKGFLRHQRRPGKKTAMQSRRGCVLLLAVACNLDVDVYPSYFFIVFFQGIYRESTGAYRGVMGIL